MCLDSGRSAQQLSPAYYFFWLRRGLAQTYGVHREAAYRYFEAHQYEKALHEFVVCDYLIPNDFAVGYMIAANCSYLGDGKAANYFFHRLLEQTKANSHDHQEALVALYRFGFSADKQSIDGSISNLAHEGNQFAAQGRYDLALQSYLSLYQNYPGETLLAYQIGITYARLHDAPNAMAWLKKADDLCAPSSAFRNEILAAPAEYGLLSGTFQKSGYGVKVGISATFLPGPLKEHPPL